MNEWIITLLVSGVGLPVACGLLSKFAPSTKVAMWLDSAFVALEKLVEGLGVRYGKKTVEQIEETALGTIYKAFLYAGTQGLTRLKTKDTDGSQKDEK